MAFTTNRNNIELMFWFITKMVMILFCLFATSAPIMTCREQFARFNGIIHFVSSFCLFGIVFAITFISLLAFCGLEISSLGLFASYALVILLCAIFAIIRKTIMATLVFVKIARFFNFLAFCTAFCFNGVRHSCFLSKRVWLEPFEVRPSFGSFYYNTKFTGVKLF